MQGPCKNCADRKIGCHSVCKAYNKFVEEKEKERQYNKANQPVTLHETSFTGTSPKPGVHRGKRQMIHYEV